MPISSELLTWCEALLKDEQAAMEERHSILLAGLTREAHEGSSSMEWQLPPPPAPSKLSTSWAGSHAADKKPEKLAQEEKASVTKSFEDMHELPQPVGSARDAGLDQQLGQDAAPVNVASNQNSRDGHHCDTNKKEHISHHERHNSHLERTFERSPQVQAKHFFHPSRLVRWTAFELFFAAMIILNSIVMAFEMTCSGRDIGYRIGFPHYDMKCADALPWQSRAFAFAETFFGTIFALECVLKIAGLQKEFLWSAWNWFDTFLVAFWVADSVMKNLPLDSNMLRLVRLARLLRLTKIARTLEGFDSLVVMTTALRGSVSSLFWVAVLLFVLQMMFALFLGQVILLYIGQDSVPAESRVVLFTYFGTFNRAMLTMFELTLGNYAPVARILQEHLYQWTVIFSVLHKVAFGFACVGVINGVFMTETLKVAHNDDVIMMREAQEKKETHRKRMHEFFEYADRRGDGLVTLDEWQAVLQNEKVRMWFAGQGLTVSDADQLFRLLRGSGEKNYIEAEELATGMAQLQGPAKSLDVTLISRRQEMLCSQVLEIHRILQELQAAQGSSARGAEDGKTVMASI